MKLYGKDLDRELAKRKESKEERRKQRLTVHKAAKLKGVKPTDILAYEYGYDVCPHEEYRDEVAGFPMPKLIFKVCKKCGKVDETTIERVSEENEERVFKVIQEVAKKFQKD